MLVAANVRKARLHDARHTAATILLVLNVPVRAVMEIMGWSEAFGLSAFAGTRTSSWRACTAP